jgi:di/tricarboxylate transporter
MSTATIATGAAPRGWIKNWGVWLAVGVLLAVAAAPTPQGLPVAGQYTLAILAFAVVLWMTEAVDYAVSAVIIAALMAFMLGLAPNPAKPDAILGTGAALGIAPPFSCRRQ